MAKEDKSYYWAYYKHLKFASKLNLFTTLGIMLVMDFIIADITVAYN